MLDDSTVVGEGCFFGGIVCTKVFRFAIHVDRCSEPLPNLVHSLITSGVCRRQFSFLFWIHEFIVIFIVDWQSIWIISSGGWNFVLDDSTVKGEGCFFGGIVCTQVFRFAINIDPCYVPLPILGHSIIPSGVCRRQFSFLATHSFQFEPDNVWIGCLHSSLIMGGINGVVRCFGVSVDLIFS